MPVDDDHSRRGVLPELLVEDRRERAGQVEAEGDRHGAGQRAVGVASKGMGAAEHRQAPDEFPATEGGTGSHGPSCGNRANRGGGAAHGTTRCDSFGCVLPGASTSILLPVGVGVPWGRFAWWRPEGVSIPAPTPRRGAASPSGVSTAYRDSGCGGRSPRHRLRLAKTPCRRVRWEPGNETRAASRRRKSRGAGVRCGAPLASSASMPTASSPRSHTPASGGRPGFGQRVMATAIEVRRLTFPQMLAPAACHFSRPFPRVSHQPFPTLWAGPAVRTIACDPCPIKAPAGQDRPRRTVAERRSGSGPTLDTPPIRPSFSVLDPFRRGCGGHGIGCCLPRPEPSPIAVPLHDDLVGVVRQPVQRALGQDGIVEERDPLLHRRGCW